MDGISQIKVFLIEVILVTTGRIIRRNGKYAYIISGPRDPLTGKYKQIWRSGFETKKAADEAMRRHLAEIEAGTMVNTSLTLNEFLALWLQRSQDKLAPRTYEIYEYTCERYIIPLIGQVILSDLKPVHIENLYGHWSSTLQPSSIHRIHRILRTALNRAVKWGYISESPMLRVDAPSNRIDKRTTLTTEQAIMALEWLRSRSYVSYLAAYLALYTGMRRGEIAGLQWHDIDWTNETIHVQRTRQRPNGQDIIGATKTQESNRVIPVTASVMQTLREWYHQHQEHTSMRGEAWNESEFVIRHLDGTLPDPNTFTHAFGDAVKALGLPHVSFHDLRHTHATWLLESGVDIKIVSDRLGHANISTTGNIYAHVTQRMQREAINKLDSLLSGKN